MQAKRQNFFLKKLNRKITVFNLCNYRFTDG